MAKIIDRYKLDSYAKIPDVWILDGNFQKLGLIDDYTSLIWSRRYYEVGDFELYVRVTDKNMSLLNVDLSSTVRFIMRNDTKEVMRIEKIEISVDAEEGDFITASGRDLRQLLYQRVNGSPLSMGDLIHSPVTGETMNTDAVQIVDIVYRLIDDNITAPAISNRRMPYFRTGNKPYIRNAFTSAMDIEAGENIGEKIEELCNDFKMGWRAEWDGSRITFECYEGADRTSSVVFSEEFANLIKFTNDEDLDEYFNTQFLNNEYTYEDGNESSNRIWFGDYSGFLRFEKSFSGSEDLDVSETSMMRDLLCSYKLPKSYELEWYSFDSQTSDDSTVYTVVAHDATEPNPDDENRTGNDYMSDNNFHIVVTNYRRYGSGFLNLDTNWEVTLAFIDYDFRIYNDEWLETLKEYFNDKGYIVTDSNTGIQYYRISSYDDPSLMLQIGKGHIKTWYIGDKGDKRFFWGMKIPAMYSSDGEDHIWKLTDAQTSSNSPSSQLQNGTIMMSFSIELDEILLQDRYMAKIYSLIEEALSTNEFEGEIAPDVNYEYRKDYDIGDKIRIKTDIGIDKDVRILEAVETFDSDGYNIEVKFGV